MFSEDRFELKTGGGALILFGLPFFLAGLGIMTISIFPDLLGEGNEGPPLFFGLPFGGVFATVGACMIFGRSTIVIDKIRGTFTRQRSLIIPFKKTEYEISAFSHVQITKEIRRSDKSTYTVYPVYLQGRGVEEKIRENRDYQLSRQLSEQLSKILDNDVVDESSGAEVIRKAGTMDQSVRDQILESGEEVILPEAPQGMKSESYMEGNSLVVEIPPAGFSPALLIGLVPLLFMIPFFGVFVSGFGPGEASGEGVGRIIFMIVPLIFFLIPLTIVFKIFVVPLFRKSKLELDKYELRYTTMGAMRKVVVLKSEEIEELFIEGGDNSAYERDLNTPKFARNLARTIGQAGGITARTDEKTLKIGAHLSLNEQQYLLTAMKQVLIS